MKAAILSVALACAGTALRAQAPAASAPAGNGTADLGFTYSVPHDWEVLTIPPTVDQTRSQAAQNAGTEDEKKGLACLQPVLTARDCQIRIGPVGRSAPVFLLRPGDDQ